MKKMILAICFVLLSGCGTKEEAPNSSSSNTKLDSQLHYTNVSQGFGCKQGHYRIVMHDDEKGNTIKNIRYFDYDSKQEIFLCDKPECTHQDEQCTSYIPFEVEASLFVSGDFLYMLSNTIAGNSINIDGSIKKTRNPNTKLYRMNLDGSHRKVITELSSNMQFENHSIVLGKQSLYVVAFKESLVAMNNQSSTYITEEKQLLHIDLDTGKTKEQCDMKDQFLVGANGYDILLQKLQYEKDPDEALKNKNYEEYERITAQARTSYELFNTKEQAIKKTIHIGENYPTLSDNLYYMNAAHELHQYNLKTDEDIVLTTMENGYTYSLDNTVWDDRLWIEVWEDKRTDAAYVTSFVYDLKKQSLTTIPLKMQGCEEPLRLLAANDKQYFLLYKKDGHMETTWAGTQQFTTDKEYYGLINKDDFWNGKNAFTTMSALHE